MKVLFLSNGHGEDLNASLIIRCLVNNPKIHVAAMPLVGKGSAYLNLGIPIIGPTQSLPSGGIIYTNMLTLIEDICAGLIGLMWRQFQAVRKYSPQCDLLVAVGDVIPIVFAHLTGRPYIAFLVSASSYYEGHLRLPWLTQYCLHSPRCLGVLTRDAFTAEDLQARGMKKALFAGYPIMDILTPTGQDLGISDDLPMLAILPGSRLPEALENLILQLKVCEEIAKIKPMQFCIALVSEISETDLKNLALNSGWKYRGQGILSKEKGDCTVKVRGYWQAFADILHECDLVLGMAGTAVEQAVGLGKPVVQIPGFGPQFTYSFAEAQMRLLGLSVVTVGKKTNNSSLFAQAAKTIIDNINNSIYLQDCIENGRERVGVRGGSQQITTYLQKLIIN